MRPGGVARRSRQIKVAGRGQGRRGEARAVGRRGGGDVSVGRRGGGADRLGAARVRALGAQVKAERQGGRGRAQAGAILL